MIKSRFVCASVAAVTATTIGLATAGPATAAFDGYIFFHCHKGTCKAVPAGQHPKVGSGKK